MTLILGGTWHWLLDVLGIFPNGTRWQSFWDGFGSGPVAWCFLPLAYYTHHICHESRCYRMGHPVNGVVKCRKHI